MRNRLAPIGLVVLTAMAVSSCRSPPRGLQSYQGALTVSTENIQTNGPLNDGISFVHDEQGNYKVVHLRGDGVITKEVEDLGRIHPISPHVGDFDENRFKDVAYRVQSHGSEIANDYIIFKTSKGFEAPIHIGSRSINQNVDLPDSVERYLHK